MMDPSAEIEINENSYQCKLRVNRSKSLGRNTLKLIDNDLYCDNSEFIGDQNHETHVQTLVARRVKPKVSHSCSLDLNREQRLDLSESSRNIMNSVIAERKLDAREYSPAFLNETYKQTIIEPRYQMSGTGNQIFSTHESDKRTENFPNYGSNEASVLRTRSLLRERFLKLIIHLQGGTNCKIRMFENADVMCKVKAFHPDFDNILVEELQTPHPKVVERAILRSDDIISLHFYDVNLENLLNRY